MTGAAPTFFVIVGLPGAGKTTRALALEAEHDAVRFTPDEWMIPLFGEANPTEARDTLEGKFIQLAHRLLSGGRDVVCDFGFWSADERWAMRHVATAAGARCVVEYLPIDPEEQRRRIAARHATAGTTTFAISDADLDEYRTWFEEPTAAELDPDATMPPSPVGSVSWEAWISARWRMTPGTGWPTGQSTGSP